MGNCNDQSFNRYFNENIEAMGLPAPPNLFSTLGLAVAIGKHFSGGLTIADVVISAQRNNIYRPWLTAVLLKWPGIIHPERPGRILYQYKMTVAL